MTIKLVWEEIKKDEDGFPVTREHEIDAYAKERSITRAETYESMRAGVRVRIILEIRPEDWERTRHIVNKKVEYARKVKVDGCEYDIIRAYKKGKASVELTCS